jgi:hypothetical protein
MNRTVTEPDAAIIKPGERVLHSADTPPPPWSAGSSDARVPGSMTVPLTTRAIHATAASHTFSTWCERLMAPGYGRGIVVQSLGRYV